MAWDNITGESRILPKSSGNSNEVKLENGKPKRVRLLLREGEEPYSYLEHPIEVETIGEGGQNKREFRTVRCPRTKNPNAHCPLCDGQQVRFRVRNVANVYDYESGSVQILNGGDDIWKPMATLRKLGIDVTTVDWAVMRTGEGRNDTEYSCTNMGPSTAVLPQNLILSDIGTDYAPHSIDEMKQIVESIGGNWDKLTHPPQLEYPATLQEALDHVMPNGKHKDQKFSQMWEADKTPKGMINFLATKSDRMSKEKACAQIILVNLGGANIPGVPKFDGSQPTYQAPPVIQLATQPAVNTTPTIKPTVTPTVQPTVNTSPSPDYPVQISTQQAAFSRDTKVLEINKLIGSNPKFVQGGYQAVIDTMKSVANGKMNLADFTDTEIDAMLEACK